MLDKLEYFDSYVFKGLMPIAIQKQTKIPIGKKWNKAWNLSKWRKLFVQNDFEIGLLWNNGMIDIETDDEKSNKFLEKLIGNIERPIYKSSRSYHNIFLSPDPGLTKINLYGKKGEKIEIFGRGTFSMAPPSTHPNGITKYEFVNDVWPPPECPNSIRSLYFQKKPRTLKKDSIKTICKYCNNEYLINKTRLILEVRVFANYGLNWLCLNCRKEKGINIKKERKRIRKTIK